MRSPEIYPLYIQTAELALSNATQHRTKNPTSSLLRDFAKSIFLLCRRHYEQIDQPRLKTHDITMTERLSFEVCIAEYCY